MTTATVGTATDDYSAFEIFHHLPNEILEEILTHLPTKFLLTTCRLVNQSWNEIASRLCRERRVRLNPTKLNQSDRAREILRLFSKSREVPWSSCTVMFFRKCTSTSRDDDWTTIAQYMALLNFFGMEIRELIIKTDSYKLLVENLGKVPNVEKLSIRFKHHYPVSVPTLTEKTDFQMLKLKELRTDGSHFEFIQILRQKSPRLESINLYVGRGLAKMEELIPLLRSVRFVTLELEYSSHLIESCNTLLDSNLSNVRGLKLNCSQLPTNEPSYYHPLEKFLQLNSGQLEKLIFCGSQHWEKIRTGEIRIQLPLLPKLKYLQLGKCQRSIHEKFEGGFEYPFLSLSEFTSDQFPALKKVRIGSHYSTKGIFGNSIFDSVESFWIENRNSDLTELEWDKVFPNLKEFTAWVEEPGLIYVFEKLQNLKKLYLSVKVDENDHHATVNSILSGIRRPGKYYRESKENIKKLRQSAGSPCLVNLKHLNHLELTFPCSGTKFTDPGAFLSLLTIQPLDSLVITYTNISCVSEDRLSDHHFSFSNNATSWWVEDNDDPDFRKF